MSFQQMFNSASEESSFEALPEGEYVAMIDNSSLDLTKKPARLSLTYKIVSGDFSGRKVFSNYNMEGRSLGFLKKDMKTLGVDYSNVKSEEDIAKLMFSQVGKGVKIFINQRDYNGKIYNNAYLNSAESLEKPLDF